MRHQNLPQKSRPSPASPFTPERLLHFFRTTLPAKDLRQLPALREQVFYHRLFHPLVTLWYLQFQWLNADHTMDAVVADARAGGADRLNPQLSLQLRSSATTSYSDACQRLPGELLAQALRRQGDRIATRHPATRWHGLVVSLLDGSTIRLRPHQDIPAAFPPHGNQARHPAYWCLMRVVAAFCARTGAALDCALGSLHLSEQALGSEIILRAAGAHLFMGDRNFGVFRIAQAARHAHHHVLLRLTDVRAAKLLGQPLRRGDFAVSWQPTRHDKLPAACRLDPIAGRLIIHRVETPGFRPQWLCLFTTLTDLETYPAAELLSLYGQRWHVELNLRHVKAQMGAGCLEARSVAMACKQWLACLLAYNLIRAAMLSAAIASNQSPLTLSFAACRRRLERWVRQLGRQPNRSLAAWQSLLTELGRCRLPKRKIPRPAEPRAKRHIRENFPPLVGTRAEARKKLQNQLAKS
jgi:hypothetical protein